MTPRNLGLLPFSLCFSLLSIGCGSDGVDPDETSDAGATSGGKASSGGSGTSTSGGSNGSGGTAGTGTGGSSQAGTNSTDGGSAGTPAAGSGGSGGTEPVVVTPCPDASAVGEWQKISPPEFSDPPNLETTCIAINPLDQSIYSAAGNVTNGGACPEGQTCPSGGTGIWKSSDCGATWSKVSETAQIETGSCFGLSVNPVNPDVMYYNNGYGNNPTIWKSTDAGVNWTAIDTDGSSGVLSQNFVNSTRLDPNDPDHILVTYHENCAAPYAPQCAAESTDAGETWRQFKGPETGGWVEGASIYPFDLTHYFYTSNNGGWYTEDGGVTWDLNLCWSDSPVDCTGIGGPPRPVNRGSDGAAYVGVLNTGIYVSRADPEAEPPVPLGKEWTKIANSPQANHVADDGVSLFSSWEDAGGHPFRTATLADPTVWTQMESPSISRTSTSLAYDETHHILYSANIGAGLWRLVTR